MKRLPMFATLLALPLLLAACGAPSTPEVPSPKETQDTAPAGTPDPYSESGAQTDLAPLAIGPYNVRALHIGDVGLGHFNLYIEGGEPAAVRAWVGDEAATGVLITLAEFEEDHHCAHLEVPQPLPAGAKLWVELETSEGERLRGSSPL